MKHSIDTSMRETETLAKIACNMSPGRERKAFSKLSVRQLVMLRDQQCALVVALSQFHQTLLDLEQQVGHPSPGAMAVATTAYRINKETDGRCQFIERICAHINERDI